MSKSDEDDVGRRIKKGLVISWKIISGLESFVFQISSYTIPYSTYEYTDGAIRVEMIEVIEAF